VSRASPSTATSGSSGARSADGNVKDVSTRWDGGFTWAFRWEARVGDRVADCEIQDDEGLGVLDAGCEGR
jgi:hypothetical protein